jgi:DNA-binding transcriptional regulator YiaG
MSLIRQMTPHEFKQARKALSLSGAALGRLVDLDERTIRRFDRGVSPVPGAVAIILRLALAYGCVRDELGLKLKAPRHAEPKAAE